MDDLIKPKLDEVTKDNVEVSEGSLNFKSGDIVKTSTGVVIGLIIGLTGGVLYIEPTKDIPNDVPVKVELSENERQVEVNTFMKSEYEKILLQYQASLNDAQTEEEVGLINKRIQKVTALIESADSSVKHYERELAKEPVEEEVVAPIEEVINP